MHRLNTVILPFATITEKQETMQGNSSFLLEKHGRVM